MSDPFFFGYGSLVNRRTHSYPEASPATVHGWVRQWKKTRLRKLVYLTVTPEPGAQIDGLIAAVPGHDWAALDEREHAYLRQPVDRIDHTHPHASDIQIYSTRPEHDSDATDLHPILLSYLDTVAQGFLQEFGAEGLERFFATTRGWDTFVYDDRSDPVYPRAQTLAPAEKRLVDTHLQALGCRRLAQFPHA